VLRLREQERARNAPRVPVVVLTADDAPPDDEQEWFDIFVTKPITLVLLETSLKVLTAQHEDRRQDPADFGASTVPADLVDEFLEATAEALAQMKIALVEGHFDVIVSAAHGVKGTGTSFGFARMSALGASLEKDAKACSRERVELGLLELERSLACA
jgi:HPt (histidine-containing phosphotransfer) domain-containing protein